MKFKHFRLLPALFLVLTSTALARTAWYVNGVSGNDSNNCLTSTTACKTVGHAISLAASGDSIFIAASTYYAHVTININLNILGSGASTTILYGGGVRPHGPVSGPVVTVSAGATVSLSNLTVTGGYTSSAGAGIHNKGTLTITNSTISTNEVYALSPWGGGISNSGMLIINNSTITGNRVRATYITENTPGGGGGILNTGRLTINNSTLSFNASGVNDASGGGIYNRGTAKINNSTLSGNGAGGLLIASGGGISNTGTLTINNSTLSGNSAHAQNGTASGGGISNGGTLKINNSTLGGNGAVGTTSVGGGISGYQGTAILKNSIVANSSAGGNCQGIVTSKGYNLSSDTTCSFSGPGDRNNINPMLGPLQNNGGPSQTMALTSGSSAIDAGNPAGCTDDLGHLLQTDQRGMLRPDKEDSGGCDMGAYELQND
jgi:hypothetical protein